MADNQEADELLQNEEEEEEDDEQFLGKELKEEKETEDNKGKGFCNRLTVLFYKLLYGIFPTLTCNSGEVKLTRKTSCLILFLLYSSHLFSAWGDRMWGFSNSLVVVLLYPDSLLMPAIYGFIIKLFAVIFGTIVGDFVDTNPRLRVIWVSLLVQNGLVAISTILFCVMFYNSWDVCGHTVIFGSLMVLVILSGSISNLATVTNTIAIEKDWVVVIADNDSSVLAILNANMRRLDLLCKLLAPIFAGILLTHTQFLFPAIPEKMAGGFIATLIIGLWNVLSFFGELGILIIVYRLVPALSIKKLRRKSIDQRQDSDDKVSFVSKHCQKLKKLATPYRTLTTGWKIFWKQEINLAGFSLASIYLTVLGFSGITATYFLTQGLTSDYIGLAQGIGGLVGITGTLAYPFIRSRVGTIRSGLFGISVQLFMLTFCVIGGFFPGKPIGTVDDSRGYYSPNCSYTLLNHSIAPSPTVLPSSSSEFMLDASQFIDISPSSFLDVSPSPSLFPPGAPAVGGISPNVSVSVILILVGVVGARFGLWMFDLSLWQLVQEKVVEEERGVVSGVINAMNSNMDMLHYVLVIAAPRPQDFRYLIVISFASVFMGWFFYCLYVRRAHGHFFHFSKIKQKCCNKEGTNEGSEPQQFSLINPVNIEEDDIES